MRVGIYGIIYGYIGLPGMEGIQRVIVICRVLLVPSGDIESGDEGQA